MNPESPQPLRALIIEDSEVDALLLQEQLKEGGYDPQSRRVDTGADLRDALGQQPWDIIFSDHNMPHFSSTEALAIVRGTGTDVPFLIVSGSIGEEAAVAAMKAGAQDYLMKGNLTRLVAAVDRELKEAAGRRARRAAERALVAQEEEFRIARQIQQQLFPAAPPALAGFDIAGASRPAAATGGDYFDFITTPQGRLLAVVGDVTGHGIGPALLMADVRAYLRALASSGHAFEDTLTQARRLLIEDLGAEHFITLLFAELDPVAGRWKCINAGHPTGFVLARDGQIKASMASTTPALGMDRQEQHLTPQEIPLSPGDLVLLLTDGILEARSAEGEEFGEERALALVRQQQAKPAGEIIQSLLDAAQQFGSPELVQDDMTVVVIKC